MGGGGGVLMNAINCVNHPSQLKCWTFSGLPLLYTLTSISSFRLCLRKNTLYIFDNLDVFKEALFCQTLLLCVKVFSMPMLIAGFFNILHIMYINIYVCRKISFSCHWRLVLQYSFEYVFSLSQSGHQWG